MIAETPNQYAAAMEWDALLAAERAKLVRLCARLSGDADAAEDLAQETLAEAWRQRHKLVEPEGIGRWLNAIARNVCLRWARARGADTSRQHAVDAEQAIDPGSLDIELERDELAALLDRALELLPPQTRDVLIQKYVDESPLAAIGERLGLSTNAVAVRLHRGRLAFRRVLATELRHEAKAFGLLGEPALAWQPTTMWCPICGAQQLQGAYDEGYGCYAIRCPACTGAGGQGVNLFCGQAPADPRGRFRTTLLRSMAETIEQYRETRRRGEDDCPECGARVKLSYTLPHGNIGPWGDPRGMSITCPHCGGGYCGSLRMLIQSLPEVRAFWKRHPRMRTLPYRDVDLDGVAAVRITFESLGDTASIDVFTTSDTWEVIRIL